MNSILALAALGLMAASAASAASDTETKALVASSAALRAAVTPDGVIDHLNALQAIADAHGGTRTAGSPGHEASVDYVAEKLREAGYAVRFETFTFPSFEEVRPPRLTMLAGAGESGITGLEPRTLIFSGAGTVEAPIWPAGRRKRNAVAQGCEASDFKGMPQGAIALVRRGECWLGTKVENAAEAGAAAVIVYNRDEGGAFYGELSEPASIPAVTLGHAAGRRLAQAARQGQVTARLSVDAHTKQQPTRNLIAETGTGNPERVVLVGAHLDSVAAGPGINDNASGAAAVLEIARQIARLGLEPANRLRFAFWGAEENGLLGSAHHVESLPPRERKRIAAVLNFDMLGSSNYARLVYDGDGSSSDEAGPDGSARIEHIFRDYFAAVGLAVGEIDFEDPSDHLSFAEHDIPTGGLVAGDGEEKSAKEARLFGGEADAPYDPCFHEACDRLDNINRTAIDELSDAAAHAVVVLGSNPES
jgi:Zn-dependent M28 family amino/carboxypeptidase